MNNLDNAHLNLSAASHPGLSGKKNEDRYKLSVFPINTAAESGSKTGKQPEPTEAPSVLAVVCDGIGGHRAGEVAAEMGVSLISEAVYTLSMNRILYSGDNLCDPTEILEEAILGANHAVYQASLTDQGRTGMGATCACVWVIDNRLYTANLGDSRIYLIRTGHIVQLTTDHTWVQEAYDAGIIDEAQAVLHPNAHVIRRYLGSAKPPAVDFRMWFYDGDGDAEALENQGLQLSAGDVIIICSDGLTDLVSDQEIYRLVQSKPLDKAPTALIDLANARGGYDNITVALIQVPLVDGLTKIKHRSAKAKSGMQRQADGQKKAGRFKQIFLGCLIMLIVTVLLGVGVFFGFRWQAGRLDPVMATTTPTPRLTLPRPTQAEDELMPTLMPTLTVTPSSNEGLATPRATITPWPTHTTVP